MKLKEFLKDHFDDYVYIKRSDGSSILDVAVKFVPFWVFVMYGDSDVDVIERTVGESLKFRIFDLMCFN